MGNTAIRERIKTAGVYQYQVADCLGVSEMTLIRWLRKPLSKEKEDMISAVIDKLSLRSTPCVETIRNGGRRGEDADAV